MRPRSKTEWKRLYVPTAKDRHIERAWLDEHAEYGGRIHMETAKVLMTALATPTTREIGHALYFKLFAEFANALEVAGAWGWLIRTRREHPLLLDALLTYPFEAPRNFYLAARRNRSRSLIQLLKLPSEETVVAALRQVREEWTEERCRWSLNESVRFMKNLAGATSNMTKLSASHTTAPSMGRRCSTTVTCQRRLGGLVALRVGRASVPLRSLAPVCRRAGRPAR